MTSRRSRSWIRRWRIWRLRLVRRRCGRGQTSERPQFSRTVFIDLETTGLSGGAGTVAFLVGCGYFDLGAFQVRQFLLTSYAAERALLAAVAEFFDGRGSDRHLQRQDVRRAGDGDALAVPSHGRRRSTACRISTCCIRRGGCGARARARRCRRWRLPAVDARARAASNVAASATSPDSRFPRASFIFLRTGDPRPLEPVLEHNRLDLVSLAAVTARGVAARARRAAACRDGAEALALGRIYERAGGARSVRASMLAARQGCYGRGQNHEYDVRAEALYRLGAASGAIGGLRTRRLSGVRSIELTDPRRGRRDCGSELRQFAAEALAIHHEHRARDYDGARELAPVALEESKLTADVAEGVRHRLARLDRKIAKKADAQLFWS